VDGLRGQTVIAKIELLGILPHEDISACINALQAEGVITDVHLEKIAACERCANGAQNAQGLLFRATGDDIADVCNAQIFERR
jgi:hypothetical protein